MLGLAKRVNAKFLLASTRKYVEIQRFAPNETYKGELIQLELEVVMTKVKG